MNKIILVICTLLCFGYTPSVFANGEITFNGSIIEELNCQTTQVNKKVHLDCSMNNNILPEDDIVFHSQLEYLDQEKNMAVMHITYN